jgi:hypothetical protein
VTAIRSVTMNTADESQVLARRQLVVVVVALVAMVRVVDRVDAFLPTALLPIVVLIAGSELLRRDEPRSRSFEALLIPAVLAGGAAAAIQLVPAGLWLVPALAVFALLLDRVTALEMRLLGQATGATDADRSLVMLAAVATAVVAFTGMAALVPGGLAEPGGRAVAGGEALTEGWLAVLALDDALIALLLGYRLSSFRFGTARDAAKSALTYAIVIAIAAGTVRAIDLPRLVGPAVLTLVFYLWDALHGTAPARRRDPRFLWETILLAVLAIVVVAWNLRLQS